MPFRTDPEDPQAYLLKIWQRGRDIVGQVADMHAVSVEDLGECWRTPSGVIGTPPAFQRAWDSLLQSNPLVATFIREKQEKTAFHSREARRLDEARRLLRAQLGYAGPEIQS